MKSEALNKRIRKLPKSDDRLYFHRYRLSNEDYHGCHQAVSSSALKELWYGKNPQYCYQKFIKKTIQFKQTPAMMLGSATHKFILERHSFLKEYAIYKGKKKVGKPWQEFKLQNPNREILTLAEYGQVQRMRDAVMRHPEANKLLSGGEAERSVFWRDDETGLLCRARADYTKTLASGSKLIIDLKTCISAEPTNFAKAICNLGYPIQSCMYQEGFKADGFAFIALEKDNDWNTVEVYELSQSFEDCGHMLYRQALENWAKYRANDYWPTYRGGITEIEPPWWFEKDIIGA